MKSIHFLCLLALISRDHITCRDYEQGRSFLEAPRVGRSRWGGGGVPTYYDPLAPYDQPDFTPQHFLDMLLYFLKHASKVILTLDVWSTVVPEAVWERFEVPEETFMNLVQICEKEGYSASGFEVVAEDGQINTLFRVYKGSKPLDTAPTVIMSHGLEDSSDAWVINGAGKAPALAAVDAGYDVWLPNYRGNYYS